MPKEFVSLRDVFHCANYYAQPTRLQTLKLSHDQIQQFGLTDPNDIWVHGQIARKLVLVQHVLNDKGFGLIIRDGWRASNLYPEIVRMRREKGWQVEGLINEEDKPHATGLAVDVSLTDLNTGETLLTRDTDRDGSASNTFGFYADHKTGTGVDFHQRQSVLYDAFSRNGFELGKFKECWHFQLKGITAETPRY